MNTANVPEKVSGVKIAVYNKNEIASFGNKFMMAMVAQAGVEEEAQKQLAAAGEAKQFLGFEMLRAVFDLSLEHEDVDVYAVFGTASDVARLNNKVLVHLGVQKQIIDADDNVQYVWTDKKIKELYSYTKELKESDEPEYTKRFNNRKRLNQRLSEAYKAAAALRDQKLQPGDLFYSEDDLGNLVPTVRNAPKSIAGNNKDGIVQLGGRKVLDGAKLSPSVSSLVKTANDKHKVTEKKGDRTDKGEKRDEEKMGMSDEAFADIVNSLRRAINVQEGKFTKDMQKQLVAIQKHINETIAALSK